MLHRWWGRGKRGVGAAFAPVRTFQALRRRERERERTDEATRAPTVTGRKFALRRASRVLTKFVTLDAAVAERYVIETKRDAGCRGCDEKGQWKRVHNWKSVGYEP